MQQTEGEKAVSVTTIPSELVCADISTKGLMRKRWFGAFYMMKVVNKDPEYQNQIKKGAKKMMKTKDIRIRLFPLMACTNAVAGNRTENIVEKERGPWLDALAGAFSKAWLATPYMKFVVVMSR